MLLIHKNDVPEYLVGSPLFENAFQEDADAELSIEIPADCFKLDAAVQCESDLRALLQTIRFWLIPEHIENSHEVFTFLLGDKDCLQRLADEFSQDFPFLSKLHSAMQPTADSSTIGKAVEFGLLGFIQYLRANGASWDTYALQDFTSLAAAYGQLHCLRYAVENGCTIYDGACFQAARGGHVECLKYAHEHGCAINARVFDAAIEGGYLGCVRYVAENFNFTTTTARTSCSKAARHGNLEVLQYLCSIGCPFDLSTARAAVTIDSLACLQHLHERGCPFDADTAHVALRRGSLACLQYLHENGCPWDDHVLRSDGVLQASMIRRTSKMDYINKVYSCCVYAIEHGCPVTPHTYALAVALHSVELIQYLHERGHQWSADIASVAASMCRLECLQYLLDHGCHCVAKDYLPAVRSKYNQLDIVECLHTHGVEWDASITSLAVMLQKVSILQYLLEHGCPTSPDLCTVAARHKELSCLQCLHEHRLVLSEEVVQAACVVNSLSCLQYALDHGCPYYNNACVFPVAKGHIDCLKCLHEHGAPLSQAVLEAALTARKFNCAVYVVQHGYAEYGSKVCAAAAMSQGYQHLQYVHENGVKWDISTCISAIQSGSFECLKYAVKRDCPVDATLPAEAARRSRRDMLKWLHRKGCPWDERTTAAAIKADSAGCLKYALSQHCPYDVDVNMLVASPQCLKYLGKRNTRRRKYGGSLARKYILRFC